MLPNLPEQVQGAKPSRPDIVFLQALLCGKASIMINTKNPPKALHNGGLRQVTQIDGDPQLLQLCMATHAGNRTA